jgi:hypothetical protein
MLVNLEPLSAFFLLRLPPAIKKPTPESRISPGQGSTAVSGRKSAWSMTGLCQNTIVL